MHVEHIIILIKPLRQLAIHNAMLELNTKSWSDADTWHLCYVHILFELSDHHCLQGLDFALILLPQILHEYVPGLLHLLYSALLVIIDLTSALLTDVAVRRAL